jgi:hypothetical protein
LRCILVKPASPAFVIPTAGADVCLPGHRCNRLTLRRSRGPNGCVLRSGEPPAPAPAYQYV